MEDSSIAVIPKEGTVNISQPLCTKNNFKKLMKLLKL